jgi:hypothetical protein
MAKKIRELNQIELQAVIGGAMVFLAPSVKLPVIR